MGQVRNILLTIIVSVVVSGVTTYILVSKLELSSNTQTDFPKGYELNLMDNGVIDESTMAFSVGPSYKSQTNELNSNKLRLDNLNNFSLYDATITITTDTKQFTFEVGEVPKGATVFVNTETDGLGSALDLIGEMKEYSINFEDINGVVYVFNGQ